jgi:hypothetical protein
MKKIALTLLSAVIVLLFQNCKKSSTDDTTTTTTATVNLQASVNGVAWTPDTLSAAITYNAATKTKAFNFTGKYNQKQIACSVTLSNATSINDFTIGTATVDATGNPAMVYSTQQKDSNGNYVFVPLMTAAENEGSVTVSSIDAVKGVITGSFSFAHRKTNYDNEGNVVSVTNTVISAGTFTDIPYTFMSK